jgi:Putative beta-barrel porin 2
MGIMRSFNLSTLATAAFATTLLCLQPRPVQAGGEGFSKDDLGGGKETVDTKSYDDIGEGKFKANPFHISVSVRGGYDDNVNLSSFDEQASWFTNLSGQLTYILGSPRTQINLSVGGGVTYYWDHGNDSFNGNNHDYDVNASLTLAVMHKATPRLTLGANIYLTYQTQPNFDTFNNGGIGFGRGNQNFFYSLDKFSAGYLWTPRFATATSFTLGVVNYADDIQSTFEDRFEYTFGNEFRFLITPTTTLVAEYRFEIVDYTEAAHRNSMSNFLLGGFDHSFSPRFNVSARGGVEFRQFDSDVPESDRTSPYAEMTVNYTASKSTVISWFSRYSLEQPNVPDSFSTETFRTSLSIRQALTTRIVAGLNVAYEHDLNDGALGFSSFTEDDIDVGFTIRYAINRTWALDAGYEYTQVLSDQSLFREYTRNRYFGGVTFTW